MMHNPVRLFLRGDAAKIGFFALILCLVSACTNSRRIIEIPVCACVQELDPGPYECSETVDLDPSFPEDSKGSTNIRKNDGQIICFYYATAEQRNEYLRTLPPGSCLLSGAPPGCLIGHYPGEPPGRPTCTVPTLSANSTTSETDPEVKILTCDTPFVPTFDPSAPTRTPTMVPSPTPFDGSR